MAFTYFVNAVGDIAQVDLPPVLPQTMQLSLNVSDGLLIGLHQDPPGHIGKAGPALSHSDVHGRRCDDLGRKVQAHRGEIELVEDSPGGLGEVWEFGVFLKQIQDGSNVAVG